MFLKLATQAPGQAEIFKSIQGEGRTTGEPRVFVRLAGCNLHCVWCDTAYTWNWAGSEWRHERDTSDTPYKFDPAREILKQSVDEVAEAVLALDPVGLVITGGEPLIQQAALVPLIDTLRRDRPDLYVEIETNGSLMPLDALFERVSQFNVSPKLTHSGNDPAAAIVPDCLGRYVEHPNVWFKFVVETAADLDEIRQVISNSQIPAERVYVMPLGTDSDTLYRRSHDMIDAVLETGFRFTDRLHIHLFGDTRGT